MPEQYEKTFKEELWGCFKYVGIPMDVLMNMPIADRRYYILMHNQSTAVETVDGNGLDGLVDEEKSKMEMFSNVKDWHQG